MSTLLIMDEDGLVRSTFVLALEREGYQTVSFPDAGPALAEVDFDEIDLIITSLRMATRGEEAIRAIRSRGITAPVVVLSSQLRPADVEHLTAIGAQRILAKPILVKELLEVVEELLAAV